MTEADVLELRLLRQLGVSLRLLASKFGISVTAVRLIVSRQTWDHVA